MKNDYKRVELEGRDYRLMGSLSFTDLKKFAKDFEGSEITVKSLKGEFTFYTTKVRRIWTSGYYSFIYKYAFNGITTSKFSDVVKALIKEVGKGFVSLKFGDGSEVVKLSDGSWAFNDDDVAFTYDTEEYVKKENAYYCESNDEWYESDEDLVYIDGDGYYLSDDDDIFFCEHCEEYHRGEATEINVGRGRTELWCERCVDRDAFCCDDCGEWWSEDYRNCVDRPDCTVCDYCYNENYVYCNECGRSVHYDYYDSDNECCDDCSCGNDVKPYHWHHSSSFTNKGMHCMPKGKMIRLGNSKERNTVGIELEVSKSDLDKDKRHETIEKLTELPLKENEIFFEHDGSLDDGGFEIITGVHTFKSLKEMPWKDILEILKNDGYRSHEGGLCGLHIHIGRRFFGSNDNAQSMAIGKIYGFYSLFWEDIVKTSRRKNFSYCDNPTNNYAADRIKENISGKKDVHETREYLFDRAKNKEGSHGVALNNRNDATFEFRLGRGTLVYESFMAWIDFTLTIAKNAKRVSFRHLDNIDDWLSGISKDTAFYLKSRNAFVESEIIKKLVA